MNRDEALAVLRRARSYLFGRIRPPTGFAEELERAIHTFDSPCACGGKEPIEKGKRWASTVDPTLFSLVRGGHYKNPVEVLVFALPAEEEGEKP